MLGIICLVFSLVSIVLGNEANNQVLLTPKQSTIPSFCQNDRYECRTGQCSSGTACLTSTGISTPTACTPSCFPQFCPAGSCTMCTNNICNTLTYDYLSPAVTVRNKCEDERYECPIGHQCTDKKCYEVPAVYTWGPLKLTNIQPNACSDFCDSSCPKGPGSCTPCQVGGACYAMNTAYIYPVTNPNQSCINDSFQCRNGYTCGNDKYCYRGASMLNREKCSTNCPYTCAIESCVPCNSGVPCP